MNILVVDDSKFMRNIIMNILRDFGYDNFSEAENGTQATMLYKLVKPAIVFLDITLPDRSGLECLKEIMETDREANVVVCSAMGQKSYISEAYKLGARDFVVKPFQADRIYEALRKCKVKT